MHIAGAVKQKLRRAKSADGSRNGGMEEHAAAAPVESGPPAGAADETPAAIIPRKAKAKNAPKKKTEKEKSVLDSLPHWLKPGVADETHVYVCVRLRAFAARECEAGRFGWGNALC